VRKPSQKFHNNTTKSGACHSPPGYPHPTRNFPGRPTAAGGLVALDSRTRNALAVAAVAASRVGRGGLDHAGAELQQALRCALRNLIIRGKNRQRHQNGSQNCATSLTNEIAMFLKAKSDCLLVVCHVNVSRVIRSIGVGDPNSTTWFAQLSWTMYPQQLLWFGVSDSSHLNNVLRIYQYLFRP
jgi:hypothetical protein